MIDVQILGIRKVDYYNKENRHVQGAEFHVCELQVTDTKDFFGRHVEKVYLNSEIIGSLNLEVGQHVRLHKTSQLGSNYAYYSGIEILESK